MKNLILFSLLVVTNITHAIDFKVLDLCSKDTVYQTSIMIEEPTTVGDLSAYLLSRAELNFLGNRDGVNSLLNTPIGDEAIEIISNERMRVYGWCYRVNGIEPDVLMSKYTIDPKSARSITWFYGYAELIKHDWISYCTPVYETKPDFICE